MSKLSPINQARWLKFKHNRRGYWSLWIFAMLFVISHEIIPETHRRGYNIWLRSH